MVYEHSYGYAYRVFISKEDAVKCVKKLRNERINDLISEKSYFRITESGKDYYVIETSNAKLYEAHIEVVKLA